MSKTIRARTVDRAHCFTDPYSHAHGFDQPQTKKLLRPVDSSVSVNFLIFHHLLSYNYHLEIWFQFIENIGVSTLNVEKSTPKYFDIDHLSILAQEKSYTMPRGLTREQRREWAKKNLKR